MNRETTTADTTTLNLMFESLKHVIIDKDKTIAELKAQIDDLRLMLNMYQIKDETRPPFE